MKKQTSNKHQNFNLVSSEIDSFDFANTIIETNTDAIIITDIDGVITFWNKGATSLYGYTSEEVKGKNISIIYTKENLEVLGSIIKKVIEGEEIKNSEVNVIDKNGNDLNILLSINGIRDKDGKVKGLFGITKDITKQKQQEADLIAAIEIAEISKMHLDNLINKIGDPVFVKDEESRLVRVNDAFCLLFGLDRDKIIGKTLAEDVSPEEIESFLNIDKQVFKTGKESVIEESLTIRGRQKMIISTRKTLYIDANNKKYLIGVIRDITDRVNIENELKKAQTIARLGSWYLDVFTNEITWSDELYKMYSIDPALPIPPYTEHVKYFTPESWEVLSSSIENSINRGESYNIELQANENAENLNWEWISAQGEAVFDAENRVIAVRGTAQDISEQKRTRLKLERALNELTELKQQIEAENIYLKEELKLEGSFQEIKGSSKPLKRILKQVEQVAESDTTVLVLGETGTGKELIAKALHSKSQRKIFPLIKVNCSALPTELIESELFGHEKGAFTGAINRKVGRFELADKGTIFLDEIGDLPIDLQTRLLRVLQESEFERLGGEKTIKVDVRVVAATNRNLEELMMEGKFRQDLYYRLNVFPITSPPLRDRKEDIPSLVNHFINKYNNKVKNSIKSVSKNTINRLMSYNWPGNIRELEHVIERAMVLNYGEQLQLGKWFVGGTAELNLTDEFISLEQLERDYITKVLEQTNGKIRGKNGAAEILGLKPTTLESRIKKLNISKNR
jgi:PAS domain S-box-containing protein